MYCAAKQSSITTMRNTARFKVFSLAGKSNDNKLKSFLYLKNSHSSRSNSFSKVFAVLIKLKSKFLLSSDLDCPQGLRTGVPEITTEEDLPWYPTGRYSLFDKINRRKFKYTMLLFFTSIREINDKGNIKNAIKNFVGVHKCNNPPSLPPSWAEL